MQNPIKIAYLSSQNPLDVHVWSGIHFSIFNALNRHLGYVYALGPYKNKWILFLIRLKKIFARVFFKKRYNAYHSNLLSRDYGKYFTKKLKQNNYDLIVAVSASAELAYLINEKIPVVFVSDALFTGALNYYKTLSDLTNFSIKEGIEIEAKALNKSDLFYFPSVWMKKNAITDFKINESKIKVAPFGANLVNIPNKEEVMHHKKNKDNSFINLLFVGVFWETKGGQKAYDCLCELIKMGYDARLTIVGSTIPDNLDKTHIINYPFIKKNTEEGRNQFKRIYLDADFLVLPTQFEAFGIVFCEAAAFGVISLANGTGGTFTSVKENSNGFLLNPESTGKDYAEKIVTIYNDKQFFLSLQESSIKRYEDELNWDKWALNLKKEIMHRQLISFHDF